MLSLTTRLLILLGLALFTVLALRFWKKQNGHGARGGRISAPKTCWLFYAVFFWFWLCPLLALDPALSLPVRHTLGLFAAFMWLRGLIELYMLYVSKNWRPPYGVTHDVLCVALVLGALLQGWNAQSAPRPWELAWVVLLLCSLGVEILYATLFFHAVQGKTVGEEGIWFADEEQAAFARINRLTTRFNVLLFGGMAWMVALSWGLGA